MTTTIDARTERRRSVRVPMRGSVVFEAEGRVVHGRLATISNDSLEVRCQLGFTLLGMAGLPLDLGLRIDGPAGGWLVVHGRVTHVRAANHSLVIAIPDPTLELTAHRDAWIVSDGSGPPEVMIVDSDPDRRELTSAAFRREGCHVFEAATPLEALHHFDGGEPDSDLIEIAQTTPQGIGDDLSNYLGISHPESHVIRISGAKLAPATSRSDRSNATIALRTRVQGCLVELQDLYEQTTQHR